MEQERLKYGKFGIDAFPLIVEKDGLYLKLSMWEMMYLFGKEMYQGNNNLPFSPNFEVENE